MNIFFYDKTFEGLLTAVFDAYRLKVFPDQLLETDDVAPLFCYYTHTVVSQEDKANRVWQALQKKLSWRMCNHILHVWHSEQPGSDFLIFRYIQKVVDAPHNVETDFSDAIVLEMLQLAKKVSKEIHAMMQFVRFQKTSQGVYFSVCAPQYNVLAFTVSHFTDRFADQRWAIYDEKRQFGYYHERGKVAEIQLDDDAIQQGRLDSRWLADDEQLFQQLWRGYFQSINIKERVNLKQQRRCMPKRYWHYLPEMQDN